MDLRFPKLQLWTNLNWHQKPGSWPFLGKSDSQAIVAFKLAMLNFDQALFYNTYNSLLEEKTFRQIFYDVFLPLLYDLGMLWQTNSITSSHEHFSNGTYKTKNSNSY